MQVYIAVVHLLFLILVSEFLSAQNLPPPVVAIAPINLVLHVDSGSKETSGKYTLINLSDRDMKVKVEVSHFDVKNGNLVEIAPDENSIAPWVFVNPATFYLKPKSKKVIRVMVAPPEPLRDGEYRALITFREVPIRSGDNQIFFSIRSQLYLQVGNPVDKVEVDIKYEDETLEIAIFNKGQYHFAGQAYYYFTDDSSTEEPKLSDKNIIKLGKVFPAKKKVIKREINSDCNKLLVVEVVSIYTGEVVGKKFFDCK